MQIRAVCWAVLTVVLLGSARAQGVSDAPCHLRKEQVSDAEAALARQDYPVAIVLYRKLAATDPDESRAGVIRVLLGQDDLKDAEEQAQAWVKAEPKNAVAAETLGEVFYRAGDFGGLNDMVQAALRLDECNARVYWLDAQLENLMAYFKTAKVHTELAHRLSPNDVDIRYAWIETLPRERRAEEWKALLKEENLLSADEKHGLEKAVAEMAHPRDACRLVTPPPSTKIKFEGEGLGVKFNGGTRFLEIDTGASGIILSKLGATGLGLVREDSTKVGGVGDGADATTSVAHAASVKIGNLEFRDCRVSIIEKFEALDNQGIIGMDVFENYVVTLDFPRHELRLDALPSRPGDKSVTAHNLDTTDGATVDEQDGWHDRYIAPEMKDWTRIYRVGHDLLMPVQLSGSKPKLFLVDTGASDVLISTNAAREVSKLRTNPDKHIGGISGEVKKVYATGRLKFEFADFFRNVDGVGSIDMTKLSHDDGVEVSGFLGMPILFGMVVHIDYRDNLMKLELGPQKY